MGTDPNSLPKLQPPQWHGPAHGVEVPGPNDPTFVGYSPQVPVNHTKTYIILGLAVSIILIVLGFMILSIRRFHRRT